MTTLLQYIKKTENNIIDINEINYIIDYIINLPLSADNISIVLKLISNLTIYDDIKQLDIDNIYESNKDKLSDGEIISLVKIYSSGAFNKPHMAIQLINTYDVHKTSSYIPLFEYLIRTNDYLMIKQLYLQYIRQNKLIIDYNMQIKMNNNSARLYNNNQKLIKQKYSELESIINSQRQIIHPDNKYLDLTLTNDIIFDELKYKSEQNLIMLNDILIYQILKLMMKNSDNEFIHYILANEQLLNQQLINLLLVYFSNNKLCHLTANNHCNCCNMQICLNIIPTDTKQNILRLIEEKINNITHRTDNGLILDKKNRLFIIEKFTQFKELLSEYDFNLIIDGGNLGYLTTLSKTININFMRKAINKLLTMTNKYTLLVIHSRHQSILDDLKISNKYLKIFFTPLNLDDDMFWLYATIQSDAYILTNDQSRNNSCMIGYQQEIKRWLEYYQIKLNENIDISTTINKYNIKNRLIQTDDKLHLVINNNEVYCIY